MCGIAGYSLSARCSVDRTLAAQALLAGIADRGADAVGYAHRSPSETSPIVTKQRTPASSLLERIGVPAEANELLIHVRDYTKGHPSIPANNHPVSHGPVVGVHNGIIANDDELLAPHSCARTELRKTVDSEAIFALAAHSGNDPRALEELAGTMAAAWLDKREPGTLFAARGVGRPLWLGRGREAVFFASTREALEIASAFTGVKLRRGKGAACRPRAGPERLLPRAARRDRRGLARQRSVARDVATLLREPPADEELERRPGAATRLEHAIDLPLGEERVVLPPRLAPVRELRQPPEPLGQRHALIDRPLEPLLPYRHVESRLAKRSRQ
jgi:asparagine synthetase B (glutamine-hydrolysing)